jgi:putative ABC transport system permease protein
VWRIWVARGRWKVFGLGIVRLALAGLRYHARAHLGVLAGFTVAAAVLTGALLVGDSVRGSLRERALQRVGQVRSVIAAEDRAFRGSLADDLAEQLGSDLVAPLLVLPGHASAGGGERRANELVIAGVDGRFFSLGPSGKGVAPAAGEAVLADVVAARLEAKPGDEILLRVEVPSALPRDMVLAPTEDSTLGLRVRVSAVLGPEDFARFAMSAGPRPAGNVFVNREWLTGELELGDRANLILCEAEAEVLSAGLQARWSLEDVQLETRRLADGGLALTSPRVFLDAPIERAVRGLGRPALGVLTYFVNALESEGASTPYSMVAALGELGPPSGALDGILPADLAPDGIVINDWTATDHGDAALGSELDLRWWVPGPDRQLVEDQRTFHVGRIVPMEGLAADGTLMPAFPGLDGEDHCRDWEPGIAIDLANIRDKDEDYWERYRGTPKAFLPLAVGQALWANRFGTLTAVRAPDPDGDFALALREALEPGLFGLEVRDLRAGALAATNTPTDFGGLFIGLSFFLIVAALLLAGLLFVFGVEQRAAEIGVLLAIGWPRSKVRRLLMLEVGALALVGSVLGAALGTGYTRGVLAALGSVWSGAVASTPIGYHGRPLTLVVGAGGALVVALSAARLALRWLARRPALALLAGEVSSGAGARPGRRRFNLVLALGATLGALVLALTTDAGSGAAAAEAFFGAGALLLVAGLCVSRLILARFEARALPASSVASLGLGSAARRPARSTTTIALLAAGTFLVVSIGVHERSGVRDPRDPASGTGGFALVGRSSLPLNLRLNTPEGMDALALSPADLQGVTVLPLRRRDGDDASCLNLGAPQRPRLLGVEAAVLADRGAFTFAEGEPPSWDLLTRATDNGAVPAIGDAASIKWVLKASVGDELTYTDGRGEPFQVRIVGAVQDSILQGSLLIDETAFRARFPADRGWKEFLIDAPPERVDEVSRRLTRALGEYGLDLEPAAARLDGFRAVQNTYLKIFQLLGALGVLLGSVGVGVVVLRNALERRRELAAMRAVGYRRRDLFRLLASEHGLLLALGIGVGLLAALMSLWPVRGSGGSLGSLAPLALVMVGNGALWVGAATWVAVRGVGFDALRNE